MSVNGYNDFKRDKTHKSEYKYVYKYVSRKDGSEYWMGSPYYNQQKSTKFYETERKAAIAVDTFLLNKGQEPINILVKK